MAKTAPPRGALKVAAIPAPAPQATSVMIWRSEIRSTWPTVDPMPAPIWAIGPSRPADPPDPIVSAVVIALTRTTRGLMIPFSRATEKITSEIPCPLASRARKKISRPTKSPPVAPMMAILKGPRKARKLEIGPKNRLVPSWIIS